MGYKDLEKQREYQRQWMAKRRAEYMETRRCDVCGSKENLELHHIDPDSKVDHRIWSWSHARRVSELEKCEVLCCDCHKEETRKQRYTGIHGTLNMYNKYGCRCNSCKARKSIHNARRTKNKPS